MARKITVSIEAGVELITTEKEEKIINALNEIELTDDDYDELYDELKELLLDRIYKEVKNIDGVDVLDVYWD